MLVVLVPVAIAMMFLVTPEPPWDSASTVATIVPPATFWSAAKAVPKLSHWLEPDSKSIDMTQMHSTWSDRSVQSPVRVSLPSEPMRVSSNWTRVASVSESPDRVIVCESYW